MSVSTTYAKANGSTTMSPVHYQQHQPHQPHQQFSFQQQSNFQPHFQVNPNYISHFIQVPRKHAGIVVGNNHSTIMNIARGTGTYIENIKSYNNLNNGFKVSGNERSVNLATIQIHVLFNKSLIKSEQALSNENMMLSQHYQAESLKVMEVQSQLDECREQLEEIRREKAKSDSEHKFTKSHLENVLLFCRMFSKGGSEDKDNENEENQIEEASNILEEAASKESASNDTASNDDSPSNDHSPSNNFEYSWGEDGTGW